MEINVHRSRVTKVEVAMKIKERMVKLVTVCGPEGQSRRSNRDDVGQPLRRASGGGQRRTRDKHDHRQRYLASRWVPGTSRASMSMSGRRTSKSLRVPGQRDISFALRTMVAQNVRRLPVVNDEGKLVGVISIDDFLLHTERGKGGVLSLEALEALKTIIENRQRCHTHEPAEMLAANV